MRRFILALICALLLCVSVFAADSITEMKTDCTVQPDGSARMTQTVTADLESLQSELRFPLAVDAKRAEVVGYKTKTVVEDGVTILVLQSNTGITGSRTFTITYSLRDLVTEEEGVQTLTLPLLCAKWEYPIEHYAFTVTMPQEFEAKPSFLSGYRGDVIEDHLTLRTQAAALDGYIGEPLKDRESLTMTLALPAGYFSGSYSTWSASWTGTAFVIALALLALVYWFLKLRSPHLKIRTRNLPPDSTQPGDVPFLLCGGQTNFNMTVCHWANLGYLTITVSPQGNVALHKRMDMGNERRRLDQKLFAALFQNGDVCDGASLQYKRTAAKAIQVVPRFWTKRLFKKTSGNVLVMRGLAALCGSVALLMSMSMLLPLMTARWLLLLLSFLAGGALSLLLQRWLAAVYLKSPLYLGLSLGSLGLLLLLAQLGGSMVTMLLAVGLAIFTGWQTVHGGRRTPLGDQFLTQTLGYRRYLRRLSLKHIRSQLTRDPQFFYKTLPYAEAMGMGADLAAKFDDLELEPCDWYAEAESAPPRTAKAFYSRWKETLALLDLSIRK